VVFLPLFFQLVLGYPPTQAGLLMAPMTVGMIAASFIGGRMVSRTGRYKIFPVVGLAAAALSYVVVMLAATIAGGIGVVEAALIVLGIGFGLVMPNLVVAIQNAVGPREQGAATATAAYFRSLGGTFGVALSGAIMTGQLRALDAEHWAGMARGGRTLLDQGLQDIALLPDAQRVVVIAAYRHAISTTFLVGAIITALAFMLVLFLPEKPLQTARPADTGEGQDQV
jgi:MFS family permease